MSVLKIFTKIFDLKCVFIGFYIFGRCNKDLVVSLIAFIVSIWLGLMRILSWTPNGFPIVGQNGSQRKMLLWIKVHRLVFHNEKFDATVLLSFDWCVSKQCTINFILEIWLYYVSKSLGFI